MSVRAAQCEYRRHKPNLGNVLNYRRKGNFLLLFGQDDGVARFILYDLMDAFIIFRTIGSFSRF